MRFETNSDLPDSIRNNLPQRAQDLYRQAFNRAWDSAADQPEAAREETAHRLARLALGERFEKQGERWVARV